MATRRCDIGQRGRCPNHGREWAVLRETLRDVIEAKARDESPLIRRCPAECAFLRGASPRPDAVGELLRGVLTRRADWRPGTKFESTN